MDLAGFSRVRRPAKQSYGGHASSRDEVRSKNQKIDFKATTERQPIHRWLDTSGLDRQRGPSCGPSFSRARIRHAGPRTRELISASTRTPAFVITYTTPNLPSVSTPLDMRYWLAAGPQRVCNAGSFNREFHPHYASRCAVLSLHIFQVWKLSAPLLAYCTSKELSQAS